MKYGLSEQQLAEIVDIAIKGKNVNADLASILQFDLEEDTYLPFFFDVIAYSAINNPALIKHIDSTGSRLI